MALPARRGRVQQRVVVPPDSAPSAEFTRAFKASSGLSKALSAERRPLANSNGTLRRSGGTLPALPDPKPLPRPPALTTRAAEQQASARELHRDAADHSAPNAASATMAAEVPGAAERRAERREALMASRKSRHDEACEGLERRLDALAEQRQEQAQAIAESLRRQTEELELEANRQLRTLEDGAEAEDLGEREEEEVQAVLSELERLTEQQRQAIQSCCAQLLALERQRQAEGDRELSGFAQELSAAAHVLDGEIERLIEERSLQLNSVLLENQRSVKSLEVRHLCKALESSKEYKLRWHRGFQVWKQQRHRHSMEQVKRRIESEEFRQPPALVEILDRVVELQKETSGSRASLVANLFHLSPASISLNAVQRCDEQNVALFERTQEACDNVVGELKDCIENVTISGEEMVSSLCQELETIDAKQEWGEHESVLDLVKVEIRPGLQANLDHIHEVIRAVTDTLSRQDEEQQDAVKKVIELFRSLAKAQVELSSGMQRVKVEYQGELEDCEKEHDDACQQMEQDLLHVHEEMREEAHFEALTELKEQAFAKLSAMEEAYRSHGAQMIAIHERYPDTVAAFFAQAAEAFCQPLGLRVERPVLEEQKEGAEPAAAAVPAPGTAGEEEATQPEEWSPGAAGAGRRVLELLALPALRERLLQPSAEEAEGETEKEKEKEAETAGAAVAGEGAGDAEGAAGADAKEPGAVLGPWDCTAASTILAFQAEWLEEPSWLLERLGGAREAIFEHLGTCRRAMDCVDVEECCEAVRRELYQRLSRHTNRKGKVQVEWFVPQAAVIAKHKEKFQRFVLEAARKAQQLDERSAALLQELQEEHEAQYQQSLRDLAAALPQAESLPALSALNRKASEEAERLQEHATRIRTQLQHLARKAPEAMRKEAAAFLAACEAERYGRKELAFYREQLEELNTRLEAKASARQEKLRALEEALPERQAAPLASFRQSFEEAEQQLCARKGYGREHGQPRRKARGAYRGLAANLGAARQQLLQLRQHLEELLLTPRSISKGAWRGPPTSRDLGSPWVFSTELLCTLSTFTSGLDVMGSQLRAFKDEHGSRYRLENVPVVPLIQETERAVPSEGEVAELELRRDCLVPVLASFVRVPAGGATLQLGESYEAEVQAIVRQVNDTYTSKGGTPDFMQDFLAKMQQSAEHAREEACREFRDWADELREGALLELGDALFGELSERYLAELKQAAEKVEAASAKHWAEMGTQRATHEQRLGPHLSSPNAEEQLLALVGAERQRYEGALQLAKEDRGRQAEVLRQEGQRFVQSLSARFETALRLLDCLPLHGHYRELPGDEHAEPPRLSIKRRMRRLQSGAPEPPGDGLPEKQWAGIPQHELRAALQGKPWPHDPVLLELEPEAVKTETTAAIDSFRSPVHKRLFERRDVYYANYKAEFLELVQRRKVELLAREEREQAQARSWKAAVLQLRGGVDLPGLGELPEVADDPPPPAATPSAPPAKAAPSSKATAKAKSKTK